MEFLMALVTTFYATIMPTSANVVNDVDVPIIMYHHIEEDESKLNEFMVTPDKFENDMQKIKEMGYETISYKELYNFVNHNAKLPKKPIIITFDDGYESNYEYAYPVLKRNKMKATIAAIGIMMGQDTYNGKKAFKHFTYAQAREMYRSGVIDIQTHSYDMHNIEKRIGIKRNEGENESEYIRLVKNDLQRNKSEFEVGIGNIQFVFTYPYGAHDSLTEQIVKELGFEVTVTTETGINHITQKDKQSLFELKRLSVNQDTDIQKLLSSYN